MTAAIGGDRARTWQGRRRAYSLAALTLALGTFTTGFAEPTLVENVTVGDLFLLGLVGLFLVGVAVGTSPIGPLARRLALPAVLIGVGSLLAVFPVGLHEWSIGDFIRDVAVGATFLAAIDTCLREGERCLRLATWALATAAVAVTVQLWVLDSAIRAQATFPNPNVAGHFLATCLVGLQVLPMARWPRRAATGIIFLGVVRTSSFGALLQVAVGLGLLGLHQLERRGISRRTLVVTGAAALIGIAVALPTILPEQNSETSGLSSERLERSASGRFEIWEEGLEVVGEYPLGIGAGSTKGLGLLEEHGEKELHNEPLAYLVERGVIGLTGFLALGVALWRLAPAGGGARALLLGFAASSLVRETSHYRHLWIVLALALVADLARRRRQGSADA